MKLDNSQKKIIFFLPNFDKGGASESIFKTVKFLTKKNFSISIISLGKNFYRKDFKRINCETIEINSSRTIFAIFKLREIVINQIRKEYKKVIFISNINYANIISILSLINIKNIKIILTERSSITELKYSDNFIRYIKNKIIFLFARYSYKLSNLVITNSKFEKKFLKKKFKLENVISIHPPSIKNIIKQSKLIKDKNKSPNIIFVGRLSKEKGVFVILKALIYLKRKKNFKFIFYGDGPEKNNMIKLIKENNLSDIVSFKGYVKDKNLIFRNTDLFLNASLWEGLPNALVQSINYNVFPICSNAPGGNIEVIKKGKLGISFKTNDEYDLYKKILKFLDNKFRLNNKVRIQHLIKYTEKKSFEKYLKVLDQI